LNPGKEEVNIIITQYREIY